MDFWKFFVDLSMKNYIENIIAVGLSFFLMVSVMHIEYHLDEHEDGYNICKIDCQNEKHKSLNHYCQKCLNKNQKLYFVKENIHSINLNVFEYPTTKSITYIESTIFDLHSRPPPSLA